MVVNVIFNQSDVFIHGHGDKSVAYAMNRGDIRQIEVLLRVNLTSKCSVCAHNGNLKS